MRDVAIKGIAFSLAAFAVSLAMILFCALADASTRQAPVQPQCAVCVNCACGNSCQCPHRKPTKPVVLDTRGAWPWQGPVRWTGAVGRWVIGAKPRWQQRSE